MAETLAGGAGKESAGLAGWLKVGRPVDLAGVADKPTGMSANKIGFTYWQDGGFWVGHLGDFPDYLTQGTSLEDLKEHLADLHRELTSGAIPNVRRHAELEVA